MIDEKIPLRFFSSFFFLGSVRIGSNKIERAVRYSKPIDSAATRSAYTTMWELASARRRAAREASVRQYGSNVNAGGGREGITAHSAAAGAGDERTGQLLSLGDFPHRQSLPGMSSHISSRSKEGREIARPYYRWSTSVFGAKTLSAFSQQDDRDGPVELAKPVDGFVTRGRARRRG